MNLTRQNYQQLATGITCIVAIIVAIIFSEPKVAGPQSSTDIEMNSETSAEKPSLSSNTSLDSAIARQHRKPEDVKRDEYRHPKETLQFFDVQPGMTVVEILPSTYYGDILAGYLADNGQYIAALRDISAPDTKDYYKKSVVNFIKRYQRNLLDVNDNVITTSFTLNGTKEMVKDGSADRVLTFRNAHGWAKEEQTTVAMNAFFAALKPGGKLGIVQHRAEPGSDVKEAAGKGYVPTQHIVDAAKLAGFELTAQSEINANPKDLKEQTVWELPPTLNVEEEKKFAMAMIGESDRMTLLFTKPAIN